MEMRGPVVGMLAALVLIARPGVAEEHTVDDGKVAERLPAELRCLQGVQRRLDETVRLLGDAQTQMRAARGARIRRDAAQAAEALEQRVRGLARELTRCVDGAPERDDVVYVDPPTAPSERAVAEENPATSVVERDRRLGPYVKVEVGEQVDGTGRVPNAAVRDGITRVAQPLHRCYARLGKHGVLPRGTLVLLFTVTPRGSVRNVKVEQGTVGGPAFARCAHHHARRALRVSSPAVGGSATYSYTFRLGPE
jgi:hypothetical protein